MLKKATFRKAVQRVLPILVLFGAMLYLFFKQPKPVRAAGPVPSVQNAALPQSILGITPPDHIVIVMEENHSFSNIIGSSQAPFINSLAQQGALFTQSFAIEHPSEPNYLDLFSGTNQGVTDDSCPHTFSVENLATELKAANLTFTGFSENLPSAGSTVCTSGTYARKHAPWVNFTNIPTTSNLPFSSFPTDFTTLPTISMVIPNLNDDMHDGTIAQGDTWLQQHMGAYIQFAQTHNSLLIVTWDEDDNSSSNQIPTIFVGQMVKQGQFSETINHFSVLRTLEDLYGLTHVGGAANATPISDVWQQVTPDFSVSAAPTSLSVNQGASGTSTISTSVTGGFNSAVSLSVSGLPAGVTASFNPASVAAPGSGSSTLTFSASSTAAAGTTNVTVTATGNGVTHTTTIALTVVATATPSFTLSASPTSLSIAQNASGSSTLTTTVSGGFNSAVSLSVAGLPTGVTASFNPTSIAAPGNGSSTLTFAVASTATPGTSSITVSATGGGITHSATISLTITAAPAPTFAISASPSSLSVVQGNSAASTISTTVSNGFNAVVSLSASGLPSGVTASFNPASIAAPGNGSSTLTLSVGSTAATGTSNITVTGTGGGVTQTTTISLTVTAAPTPAFTLSASPTTLSIVQGNSGSSTISTTVSGGFNNAVSLSASGLPTGVTASFSPASIAAPGSGSSTLTLSVASTATPGTSSITVTGAGGGLTQSATISLTVTAAPTPASTLSASPTSLSIVQGNSGSSTISTTVSGGFNNAISLSASGLPAGVTASFNPTSIAVPGSGSSTLTFSVASTATPGTSSITVTGTGGGITQSATISLTITAAPTPAFTLSASPTSVSVVQGGSGSSTLTTTVSGGFNSAVSLSASGLPTGVTASFNPTSIAAPGSGSSTLTFAASSTATTGTANVTVTATGGGITHTAVIALTVTASTGGNVTTQILGNPGFENGPGNPAPWTVTTTASTNRVINSTSTEPPHSGTFDAWLDGHGSTTTDTLLQQVSIPSNATAASLSFFLHIDTAETSTTRMFDTLTVQVRNSSGSVLSTLATFSNLNHAAGYQQHTFDLSSFAGQTIQIFLQGKEDFELQTSFVVDDFALNVTAPSGGTPSTTPGTTTELIGNGGLENGSSNPAPWTVSTTQSTSRVINSASAEPPHSGAWDAWLDGHGSTTTDSISQQVTIPSNATAATLSFWLHIDTAETSTTKAFDTFTAQVLDTSGNVLSTLATFSNLNAASGYQQQVFDVSSFKGQTVQILLQGKEDFTLQTSFVVDDISLQVTQ